MGDAVMKYSSAIALASLMIAISHFIGSDIALATLAALVVLSDWDE